jgi:hypothetical protein
MKFFILPVIFRIYLRIFPPRFDNRALDVTPLRSLCCETRYVSKGVNLSLSVCFVLFFFNFVHFGTRCVHATVHNMCLYFTHLTSDLGKKKNNVRNPHIVLLIICVFHENQSRVNHVLIVGVN